MELTNNISQIAQIIVQDWKKVNFAAKPFLKAMLSLNTLEDDYGNESAESVVRRFLSNAGSWRGEIAKQVKAKLRNIVGD